MKHLYYFKENNESNLEQTNNDFTILFENENWLIEKANSVDALLNWAEEGDINMNSYKSNFSNIFLNTNKKTDDKIVFDFYRSDFFTLEDENIDLKEIIEDNTELLNFYGENLTCKNVIKDGDDYWLVVDDYSFFTDYFKVDRNTSSDFIKVILSGDAFDLFDYNQSSFSIQDSMKLNKDNLDLIKIVLALELINNDYDYDINDIGDYSDVVDIIEENDMEELKDILLDCIRSGHESADCDEAWNNIISNAYSFFSLLKDSITWNFYNNSKEKMLWIKFETKTDAYNAKFIINKYDDSYQDDIIKYSPPYYGYTGSMKDIINSFNEVLPDKIYEYSSSDVSSDDISKSYDIFSEEKVKNPEIKVSDIIDNLKFYFDTKKFNI
jgi:hypothetical protein